MKEARLFVLATLAAAHFSAASPAPDAGQAASPDGRFVFQFQDGDEAVPFAVFSKDTGEPKLIPPPGAIGSFARETSWIWSPDSKGIALNYRAGARYKTASVFRWDGASFRETESFEELLTAEMERQKDEDRRRQGIGKDAYEARVWDSVVVDRWIDGGTVEVEACSVRSIPSSDGKTSERISGGLRAILELDARGRWKILSQEPIDAEQAMEENLR